MEGPSRGAARPGLLAAAAVAVAGATGCGAATTGLIFGIFEATNKDGSRPVINVEPSITLKPVERTPGATVDITVYVLDLHTFRIVNQYTQVSLLRSDLGRRDNRSEQTDQ